MTLQAVVALIVALSPVVYWSVDLVKDLKDAITKGEWNAGVTKLLAVLVSFGVLNLLVHSGLDFGKSNPFISKLAWQALLLASLVFAATGGLISDHLRARNPADTTVKSKLLKR